MQEKLITYPFRRHSEQPLGQISPRFNGLNLAHVALHNSPNANAGDTILPQAVRQIFDSHQGQFGWHFYQLWDRFSARTVEDINQKLDGLVIGGGGFIIKDQWGSDIRRSGWSWNISIEELRALKVPYCLFAVGYNRFRNQEDFDDQFAEHISLTVKNAMFVGLRNSGSIRLVSRYMNEPALVDKLTLQYCPTTCCYQLWPDHAKMADAFEDRFEERSAPVLAFNFAGDRLEMRFNDRVERMMSECAELIWRAARSGWRIILATHKQVDRQIEPYLDKLGVSYVTHDLTFADHLEIMDFYAEVDLVLGMRGHSQLVPLGLRKPLVSIISHDKIGYLLEDIEHPEWGCDVDNRDWVDILTATVEKVGLANRADTLGHVRKAQEMCWTTSEQNVDLIARGLQERKIGGRD